MIPDKSDNAEYVSDNVLPPHTQLCIPVDGTGLLQDHAGKSAFTDDVIPFVVTYIIKQKLGLT